MLNNNPSITAIVPVRQGSRRLKNKNLAPFAGTNLLVFKIRQLKMVPQITNVTVSSDSDMMLAFADAEGASTHKRAPEYCDEKTKSFGEVVRHICESVRGDHIVWATCTAPLVFPQLYSQAIEAYFEGLKAGYDSLMSVESFKRYMWDQNGPLNYSLGLGHVPSQDLPELHIVSDGILIAPREKMIEWNYFHGPNPKRFVVGKREAADVDDGLDLEKARAWLDMDESVSRIDPFELDHL